jgi:very-short-patch-repair endonuclease
VCLFPAGPSGCGMVRRRAPRSLSRAFRRLPRLSGSTSYAPHSREACTTFASISGVDVVSGSVDRAIATVATRQSGVISRGQLLRLGLERKAIDYRLTTGRLIPIHRGVYAVGHEAVSDRGRVIAALLAAGPHAVASHRTAAALLNLIPSMPAVLDVTSHSRARRSRSGLIVHETRSPPPTERRQGIPVTAPLRTLADLARTRPKHEVERATTEALVVRLVTQHEVDTIVDTQPAPTRLELERRMLTLLRDAGLPEPRVNHPIGPYVVDFAWLERRVLVETDGYATHGHRTAFENDRARDAALQVQGYTVLRFTWRQVTEQPFKVAAQVAQVLSRGSAAPAPAPA